MTRQTLTLDGFPTPRQVEILGPNSGTFSPFTVASVREAVHRRVKIEAIVQGIEPVSPPARLTLRYVFPDARARDPDNFAIVGKPIVDGLVRAGILAGDDAARLIERVEIVTDRDTGRRLDVVLEGVQL